ncbi:MAG: InlB B-repeat-containing protein, partial [Candidatus Humimicrobiaceae bacterium]
AGWETLADGNGTTFDSTTPVTLDITVYAQWTVDPTYTITFNSQGGSTVLPLTNITSGSIITLPTPPILAGHTFAGWWTSAIGGTEFTATTQVTSDTTLYAHWSVDSGKSINGDAPGKGSNAPGQQKPFNPDSQAPNNAGKKK